MNYYKWLTPGMTSHYDRHYCWRVGQVHTVDQYDPPSSGPRGRGLYLLRNPVDALRFGHWPGRLFEAEPVGRILAEDGEKVRCCGAILGREMDPAQVFGRNGQEVVDFLARVGSIPWLTGCGSLGAAADAAMEHQARLAPWGWSPVPVETVFFDDWIESAAMAGTATRPAVISGASTAWATTDIPWAMWTTPWAASASWRLAWMGVHATAGAGAWAMAREKWQGTAPWPSPNDDAWRGAADAVRAAIRVAAGAAAADAANAAEYLVCSGSLPQDPFEPLMEVWRLGYWPMGVVDHRYLIGDLPSVGRAEGWLGDVPEANLYRNRRG